MNLFVSLEYRSIIGSSVATRRQHGDRFARERIIIQQQKKVKKKTKKNKKKTMTTTTTKSEPETKSNQRIGMFMLS